MEHNLLLKLQQNEFSEYIIYKKLALISKKKEYREILEKIAEEELRHYNFFKGITQKDTKQNNFKVFIYLFLSRSLGLNFALKLMEKGESLAPGIYEEIKASIPQIEKIIGDEKKHESELISLINEEHLRYISSMVLGLNDALVELTAALVGFSFALQNTRLIAIVGLITGISASMSMSASEYLSTKQEDTEKSPIKASIYTGFAYILTVLILVLPYFFFKNLFLALGSVITSAILIIFIFNFYISITKELNFRKRFLEMFGLSLSVALINFAIGLIIRRVFKIDI
ncbi:MAG: VIT1/CCC1 transporter family protein [Candidatus Omnitrophica bacterium]|nr:VIT1/CCC1 transporter family protein [Candidatus Omnitrophota bacterium]